MYGDRALARQPAIRMRSTSSRGSTAATAARGDWGYRGFAWTLIGDGGSGAGSTSCFSGSCTARCCLYVRPRTDTPLPALGECVQNCKRRPGLTARQQLIGCSSCQPKLAGGYTMHGQGRMRLPMQAVESNYVLRRVDVTSAHRLPNTDADTSTCDTCQRDANGPQIGSSQCLLRRVKNDNPPHT